MKYNYESCKTCTSAWEEKYKIAHKSMLTLRSGMLNLWLAERLLVRVVAAIILSHVCWQVFSPGAEISQNSVMVTALVQLEETERRTAFRLMCAAVL